MKKKVTLLFAVLLALVIMAGCSMKELISVNITKDGKASMEVVMAYGDETIDQLMAMSASGESKTFTDEERWAYLESGSTDQTYDEKFTTERYEEEGYKGFKLVAKDLSISDLVYESGDSEVNANNIASEGKLFTKNGNEYTMEFTGSDSDSSSTITSGSGDEIVMKISITLPAPAKSNNATEVSEDKLTYTWDLLKAESAKLVFELDEVKEEKAADTKSGETKATEAKTEETEGTSIASTSISWTKASNWALDELKKANEKGVIPSIFDKNDLTKDITRREFAHIAVKLYDVINGYGVRAAVVPQNPFTDTDDIEVLWAYDLGITNGVTATTFEPDGLITREQMATMLTRAITKSNIDTKVGLEKVEKFADDADLHDWSREAVYFMSNNEIIKGIGEGKFGAKNNSTIEQALIIALRSVEKLAK